MALFEFDLVAAIGGLDFGETNWFTRIVYILIRVSGVAQLLNLGSIATREE